MPLKIKKERFIQKAKTIHNDKYDYSKTDYKHSKIKVIIICSKHGKFNQNPNNHLNGQGCPKCRYEENRKKFTLSTQEFIERSNIIHDFKYSYNKVNYINSKSKVIITCPKHGDFKQKAIIHLQGYGCATCKSSKGERIIKRILDKFNIEYLQQYKIPGNKYQFRYDFYLPDRNLLIEFQGEQHYRPNGYFGGAERFLETQRRDIFKRELAKLAKINLIEIHHKNLELLTDTQFEDFIIRIVNQKFKR